MHEHRDNPGHDAAGDGKTHHDAGTRLSHLLDLANVSCR
jgi:hypothetical protein